MVHLLKDGSRLTRLIQLSTRTVATTRELHAGQTTTTALSIKYSSPKITASCKMLLVWAPTPHIETPRQTCSTTTPKTTRPKTPCSRCSWKMTNCLLPWAEIREPTTSKKHSSSRKTLQPTTSSFPSSDTTP